MNGPTEIVPGLFRLPVPLPGHSIAHANIYALVDGGRILLIDTGWCSSSADVDALLRSTAHSISDVERVLCTHHHSDHCGLSAVLQRAGARIAMHADDAKNLDARYFHRTTYVEETERWCDAVGAPADARRAALEQIGALAENIEPFQPDEVLRDGQHIRFGPWHLTVLHTPGHTPGHCCFFESTTGMLFTGDHVFARIMASPTFRPQSPPDPVGAYLRSLDRLEQLTVSAALPGHGEPLDDLSGRLQALRSYHHRRMARLVEQLAAGDASIYELAANLPRKRGWEGRDWTARLAALGETYGHLLRLRAEGRVAARGGGTTVWQVRPSS